MVRLTDRPDMTLDVYRGRKTTIQHTQPNTLIFFVEKMREAFAMQKFLTFFSIKNTGIFQFLTFEILTKG